MLDEEEIRCVRCGRNVKRYGVYTCVCDVIEDLKNDREFIQQRDWGLLFLVIMILMVALGMAYNMAAIERINDKIREIHNIDNNELRRGF